MPLWGASFHRECVTHERPDLPLSGYQAMGEWPLSCC